MARSYTVPSDQERRTPPWLYHHACQLAGIAECQLDAFADFGNRLCSAYYNSEENGLLRPWRSWTFANPPFALMPRVVDKALAELDEHGVCTILIGPMGCSQKWFHALWPYADIYLPDQRIQYLDREGRPTTGAMQDTAVYLVRHEFMLGRPSVDVLRVGAAQPKPEES